MLKLHEILDYRVAERFSSYGLFHLLFFIPAIIITVLFCIFLRKKDEKVIKKITLILWITIVVLELYKQFVYNFHEESGELVFEYKWNIFPYQFCSTPLYAFPFYLFTKNKKLEKAMIAFFATFVLFGGLSTMVYPEGIYDSNRLGVCIQSMIHHSIMMILGFLFLVRSVKDLDYKFYLKSVVVFLIFVAIAVLLNETMYYVLDGKNFNMFYISSHFKSTLPLLSIIYTKVPYFIFLPIYILGFGVISLIFTFSAKGIYKLVLKYQK